MTKVSYTCSRFQQQEFGFLQPHFSKKWSQLPCKRLVLLQLSIISKQHSPRRSVYAIRMIAPQSKCALRQCDWSCAGGRGERLRPAKHLKLIHGQILQPLRVLAYQLCSSAKTCFIFLMEASISSLTTTRYRASETVHRWRSFTDFSILEPIQAETH